MRDLNNIMQECRKELEAIGIHPGVVTEVFVNTRAKRRWGQCIPSGREFKISISYRLMDESVDLIHLKNTMIHELLHTVKGCCNHQAKWKALAEKVNRSYPQYNIKRTTNFEEKGMVPIEHDPSETVRYRFVCVGCGKVIARYRASNFTKHPEMYHCSICGGKFDPV